MSEGASLSKYYQSFSGTDTIAFMILPECTPIALGTITTISYSIYRNKKPVINIGRTNINGITRGSRIYAGTMIFTLINQHWLREAQEACPWLKDFNDLKADELPLFDIMIVSANEYGSAVSMYIYGIDFTDEAQTLSVEDLFTENTFSFVARELSTFKAFNTAIGDNTRSGGEDGTKVDLGQRYYILDHSTTSIDDLLELEQEFSLSVVNDMHDAEKKYVSIPRDMYYSTTKLMIGNDVAQLQQMLNNIDNMYQSDVNGIFDDNMDKIIRLYQSNNGLDIDGVVNTKLYNHILENSGIEDVERNAVVVNRYGAYVYASPSLDSDIVDVHEFKEQIKVTGVVTNEDDGTFQKFYVTDTGYIQEEDLYSAYYTGSIVEFPKVQFGDSNTYVTIAQTALTMIYPLEFTNVTGEYDDETMRFIKRLQEENNLAPTGILDNDTWLVLQSLSGSVSSAVSNDNFKLTYSQPPGNYKLNKNSLLNELPNFSALISCDNLINVKLTTISKYGNQQEINTKGVQVKDPTTVGLDMFRNAFIYNPKFGGMPDSVDFILYADNKKAYKWTFST